MSLVLRVLLIISSAIMILAVLMKVRRSKFQIHDGIFWFFLSLLFLVLSVFPQIAIRVSSLIGFESPANFVFLCILTLLIIKNFLLSAKVSMLEYKLVELAQRAAIEKLDRQGFIPGINLQSDISKESSVDSENYVLGG